MNEKDYQRILDKIRIIRQKAVEGYRRNETAAREASDVCQMLSLLSSNLVRSTSERPLARPNTRPNTRTEARPMVNRAA